MRITSKCSSSDCILVDFSYVEYLHQITTITTDAYQINGANLDSVRVAFYLVNGNSTVDKNDHGLQTSNEGINQRDLKIWADVADKICFSRT